jgi:16S rRNA (guanine966-N2)-methyltransferase
MPTQKKNADNRVRISAGKWRSRVLQFPDVDGLRPTGDRIRQTLFNWLGQTLSGKTCLDAFSGSGALGFEAASRGATLVVMCETNRDAMIALKANQDVLKAVQCKIVQKDAFVWLASHHETFDVVFCDPPFAANLHTRFLNAIKPALHPESVVYVEADSPLETLLEGVPDYEIVKSSKAGAVFFGLLRLKASG